MKILELIEQMLEAAKETLKKQKQETLEKCYNKFIENENKAKYKTWLEEEIKKTKEVKK